MTLNAIHYYSLVFFALVALPACPFTIMIDPAGDAKTTGRQLDDSFERGISLQCAQQLQKKIESRFSNVNVILTRMPGETVSELQNANFANRMGVDLYVSIHFYKEQHTLAHWYIYCYGNGNDALFRPQELAFYRYDQAHLLNAKSTQALASSCFSYLINSPFGRQFVYHQPQHIPFKPLVGIKAPAFACEIGLKNKESWKGCVEPLYKSLEALILASGSRA